MSIPRAVIGGELADQAEIRHWWIRVVSTFLRWLVCLYRHSLPGRRIGLVEQCAVRKEVVTSQHARVSGACALGHAVHDAEKQKHKSEHDLVLSRFVTPIYIDTSSLVFLCVREWIRVESPWVVYKYQRRPAFVVSP